MSLLLTRARSPALLALGLLGAVAIAVGAVASRAVLGVLLLIGVMALSLGFLSAIGAFERIDRQTKRAIVAFFGLKLLMTAISLKATSLVFAGSADAVAYNTSGRTIAADWSLGLPAAHGSFPGTGGVDLIVADLYKLTVPNEWLAFSLFSWASAVGTLLLWHGASRGWPERNRKQLGLALMFLPSILYWTSPISKEAIVMLGSGIFVFALSYIFDGSHLVTGSIGGLLGGGLVFIVRPNITLLLLLSAAIALLLPWDRKTRERPSRAARVAIVALILVALVPVLAANRQLLHLHPGQGFVQGSLSAVQNENNIGGNSAFATSTPTSILGVPWAVISVLFRPFPWEIRTPLMAVSSAESVFLIVWLVRIVRRWYRGVIRPRLDGFGVMSTTLLLVFCFIYSSLGNFGLLVRERVTVLPFLLILMAGFRAVPARAAPPPERSASSAPGVIAHDA
jgi:hypothetical protein